MSGRLRLLLLATAVGVVLPYLLGPLRQLEWKSYDSRLKVVRDIRGNLVPSLSIRMFGRDERTLRNRPNWDSASDREAVETILAAKPALVWIDPKLEIPWTQPEGITRVPPLSSRAGADGVVRTLTLAEGDQLSPALVLYAALKKIPLADLTVGQDTVRVGERVLPRNFAVDFPENESLDSRETQRSANASYLVPNALWLLDDPATRANVTETLADSAVLVSEDDVQARFNIATPIGPLQLYQLEFAALDTLLSGWVLQQPPLWGQLAIVIACTFSVAAATFFLSSTLVTAILWILLGSLYHYLCIRAFAAGWWLPEVPVLAGTLTSAAIVAIFQRIRAIRLMSKLLGTERAIRAAGGEVRLGGAERPVTIVFTNLPEQVKALELSDPEGSIRARNIYNALLTAVIRRHQGWVLDYQGDAQMAGFGVEQVDEQNALHAVRAALELQRILSGHYPQENIHCGVCSGPAAVGLVGAPGAKALAAIGDTTNVAARLMGAAMKQKVNVLIAKTVYDQCSESLTVRELPPVALKGKTSNVQVYAVEAAQ